MWVELGLVFYRGSLVLCPLSSRDFEQESDGLQVAKL